MRKFLSITPYIFKALLYAALLFTGCGFLSVLKVNGVI